MANSRVFRVGLTGGIASGKSTVAKFFAAVGVPIIDTDQVAREVVEPGQPPLERLVERFGRAILTADGHLDRPKLREIVFSDPRARADLEALTHPAIGTAVEAWSAAAGGPYQILILPLLVEKNLASHVDRVLVVDCDEELQIRRLQAQRRLHAGAGARHPERADLAHRDGSSRRTMSSRTRAI